MKALKCKKLIATVLCVVMCLGMGAVSSFAAVKPGNDVITPQNIAIIATDNFIELGSLGKLTCLGSTEVQDGYNAKVTVELQRYQNGSWTTIKTWTDYGDAFATVDKDYYVTSGYYYRLKITHQAYTYSGTLVETIYKYSDVINYGA